MPPSVEKSHPGIEPGLNAHPFGTAMVAPDDVPVVASMTSMKSGAARPAGHSACDE